MKKIINKKKFLSINRITLGAVYLLILVGSIVRVMDAGMGCPDWPKCFGAYIPPSSVASLPTNYQDIYTEKRISKNQKLAKLFDKLGFNKLSNKITKDPEVLIEHEFNVTKAWIEYINRLLGVLIGLFVFLNMIYSFFFLKKNIRIPLVGVGIVLLTGFQGWIGSLVVSTNLLHGFITFHLLLALLIVAFLIWMNIKVRNLSTYKYKSVYLVSVITMLLLIIQVIFGTEVRGSIDDFVTLTIGRSEWYQNLSQSFYIHRTFSWLILISCLILLYYAKKTKENWIIRIVIKLSILIILIMIVGIGMSIFNFPFWLQPIHLILAVAIFSWIFYLTLRFKISH